LAAPTIPQIEQMLGGALGRPVRVTGSERIEPWSVLRCQLEGAAPRSVIVKWVREHPDGLRVDPRQAATEHAALEFLAGIRFAAAPRPMASNLAAGVLILEDLAPRRALADHIREDGAEAMGDGLLAFARAMGELGAATVGRAAAYEIIRAQYGPVDRLVGRERGLGPLWPEARRRLEALGLGVPDRVARELDAVVETLLEPGPFLVFSNGDPQANNFLVGEGGGRLIDFEFADFRHALIGAVWMHVPGPAWLTVAHPRATEFEAGFRQALAAGVPEAEDDALFGFGLAATCLAEACDRFGRFASLDARAPGDTSRVQMISTLEAAAAAARRHRALPQLAGWADRVGAWLRSRWPDADVDLAGYPPYASR